MRLKTKVGLALASTLAVLAPHSAVAADYRSDYVYGCYYANQDRAYAHITFKGEVLVTLFDIAHGGIYTDKWYFYNGGDGSYKTIDFHGGYVVASSTAQPVMAGGEVGGPSADVRGAVAKCGGLA